MDRSLPVHVYKSSVVEEHMLESLDPEAFQGTLGNVWQTGQCVPQILLQLNYDWL